MELTYMYFVADGSKASTPGWHFGPPGTAYKMQLARPEEIATAKAAGWRETLGEAWEFFKDPTFELAPLPSPEIETVIAAPVRKTQPRRA